MSTRLPLPRNNGQRTPAGWQWKILIRNAYTATFINAGQADDIADELGLPSAPFDGNFFLLPAGVTTTRYSVSCAIHLKAQRVQALQLLQVISDKDLRDTPEAVLEDHLQHTPVPAIPIPYSTRIS